jgi:hypothetical protein
VTPQERAAWGRVGGLTAQARHGGRAMTGPARDGFRRKWEQTVDPDGILDPHERSQRAEKALRAHMLRLAQASARVRARKRLTVAPDRESPPKAIR